MSDPTNTPIEVSVTATDHHDTTIINQTIINNTTIVRPAAHGHGGKAHATHANPVRSAPHPHYYPNTPNNGPRFQPDTIQGYSLPPTLAPQVSFAPDGDRITRYQAHDGASATYREDKQNGNAVTLTLQDGKGTLTTHGDRRGYEYSRVDALGRLSDEHVTLDTYWKSPLQVGSVVDKINCPNTGLQGTNVIPTITGDVTRDKLQQFAGEHPELRRTLEAVRLPVTVSGGHQQTFGEALNQPSEFRSCPAHSQERLQRK